MKKIDVIYTYEHVARELDVACAVKCIAEQHFGISIELVNWSNGLPEAFKHFRPGIVVLPYYYDLGTCHPILLEWRESIFVNLAWEQLLSPATRDAKVPGNAFARKHVLHQAWGESFSNDLQDKGIPRENIFINGNPAYMLYQKPYRQYFKQRITLTGDYDLDMNSRWIFLPENFTRAFDSDDKMQDVAKILGMTRDRAYTIRQLSRLTFRDVMTWCAAIAGDSNVEVIIRPRPATPLNAFKDAVQEAIGEIPECLRFIKEGSIREWIMASDIVISSYSTSLIEAAIAGKIAYLLEPYPIPEFLYVDWLDHIKHLKNQAEFESACLNPSTNTHSNELASWARNKVLARGDAIWNLAEFLAKLCRGEIKRPPLPNREIGTPPGRLPLPKWALYEYRKIRYRKSRRNGVSLVGWRQAMHEDDQLSQGDVERRISKWKRVLLDYII